MQPIILHIDMDAFYASIETLDNPDLEGKCVIVGGPSKRGVVSAANYLARKCGVRSAMPVFEARRKCPQAVFLPPRMARYQAVSGRVMAILTEFSPRVEPVSIDEAYLDISGCKRLFGTPQDLAIKLKAKIQKTVHLNCSVGIAPSKFLAKIASDMDKPDGLFIIRPDQVAGFIATLPIERVPGVGKTAFRKLVGMGIKTLGDVSAYPPKSLDKALGKFGNRLISLAKGLDNSQVTPHTPAKSVSREQTLSQNTADKTLLKKHLLAQSMKVAHDLRQMDVKARTITLKVKESDFKQVTRRKTLSTPTMETKTIYEQAVALLSAYRIRTSLRLIGVGASGLISAGTYRQMDLFNAYSKPVSGWERLDHAVDAITDKFGLDAVKPATLTDD